MEDMKMRQMKFRIEKIYVEVAAAVLLVLVSAFCISGTVMSQTKQDAHQTDAYYHAMENDYMQSVRSFLDEKGYRNSGVMMTSVTEDGERSYTVTVHHARINALSAEEQRSLFSELQALPFADAQCEISYTLLHTEGTL